MVERDINWINQRWFNLGIGTESMVELHFTCVDLRFVISRLNPMLRLGAKNDLKSNTQSLLLNRDKFQT